MDVGVKAEVWYMKVSKKYYKKNQHIYRSIGQGSHMYIWDDFFFIFIWNQCLYRNCSENSNEKLCILWKIYYFYFILLFILFFFVSWRVFILFIIIFNIKNLFKHQFFFFIRNNLHFLIIFLLNTLPIFTQQYDQVKLFSIIQIIENSIVLFSPELLCVIPILKYNNNNM